MGDDFVRHRRGTRHLSGLATHVTAGLLDCALGSALIILSRGRGLTVCAVRLSIFSQEQSTLAWFQTKALCV